MQKIFYLNESRTDSPDFDFLSQVLSILNWQASSQSVTTIFPDNNSDHKNSKVGIKSVRPSPKQIEKERMFEISTFKFLFMVVILPYQLGW